MTAPKTNICIAQVEQLEVIQNGEVLSVKFDAVIEVDFPSGKLITYCANNVIATNMWQNEVVLEDPEMPWDSLPKALQKDLMFQVNGF